MQYHIDFVSIDASTSKAKSFLKSIGGKSQVPFIIDTKNHEMLYESDDIIKYLRLV